MKMAGLASAAAEFGGLNRWLTKSSFDLTERR